jgi:hypothetical protein
MIAIVQMTPAQVFASQWRPYDHATSNIHTRRRRNCSPSIPAFPGRACAHRPFPFDHLAPGEAGRVSAPSANLTKAVAWVEDEVAAWMLSKIETASTGSEQSHR